MQIVMTPTVKEAAASLAENLLASEAFLRYQKALDHLNADTGAQALLQALSALQASLRKQEAISPLSQEEIDRYRALQRQVQENPVIAAYTQAQQEAVKLLRQVNGEISQLLGIDFASFAKHSSCC